MKPNGVCPYCNRTFELRRDGRIREHKRPNGNTCEGTGLQFDAHGCTSTKPLSETQSNKGGK